MFFVCRLCYPVSCRFVWFKSGAFSMELADWEREHLGDREFKALAYCETGKGLS